jgi:thermolysin
MASLESLTPLIRRDPHLQFRWDPSLETIRHLRGDLAQVGGTSEKAIGAAARTFVKKHRRLFGPVATGKWTVLTHTADGHGGSSLTLQQHHGPYPVEGGSVRVHVSKAGRLDSLRNGMFPDLSHVPKKPKVDAERAVKAAQKAARTTRPPSRPPELLVARHDGKPYLVWDVRIDDTRTGERGAPAKWVVHVDSATGRVLLIYDNVQTAGPVVGNGTGYYSGAGTLNAWFNDVTYQLRDTTRTAAGGPEVVVNDEDGASPSEDVDNNWNATSMVPRDAHQGPEVDALRYAGAVVDYFQTVHGRNSLDGAGGNVTILSHLGNNYNNGYWDGTKVNLGDGSGAAPGDDYECSDDWLAHELTHGYTQFTCGLVYLNESGALNEAFSDVFAAFVTGDWLVFEDTWLNASAPAWRNMVDPTNGGQWNLADPLTSVLAGHQPSHYSVRYVGGIDNGGVHINSGIINHLFYLLTVGGTHAVSGITVTAIGQSAVESLLWRCMTDQLVGQPNATFLDFRVAMLDAALDLFPADLALQQQVARAFDAVGIGADLYVRDNLTDTGIEPFPGSYLWASPDIINRTAPAANPAVDFANLNDDSLWQNVEFGQDNYVYVRVQNRGLLPSDTTIQVYFSAASTFSNPAAWTHVGTMTETNIAPGSLRIAGPLTFAQADIPSPGHYCMIAVISDSLDPVPQLSSITTVSEYLDFVRKRNNVAYRNMDVVDVVAGTPGVLSVHVGTMPGMREYYGLQIDLSRFVPGARIRVRAPRGMLAGAIARGMKLVARNERQDFFEVMAGRDVGRQLEFLRAAQRNGTGKVNGANGGAHAIGFDRILLAKPQRVNVEYLIPEAAWNEVVRDKARRQPPELVVRQTWHDEVVGAVGLRLRREPRREVKKVSRKAARKRRVR